MRGFLGEFLYQESLTTTSGFAAKEPCGAFTKKSPLRESRSGLETIQNNIK